MFAAVGAAVDNETETQQFMLPVTIPLILAIVVMMNTFQNPNSALSFWFSIIPFTSPIIMMARIPFGVPDWQLALSAAMLVSDIPISIAGYSPVNFSKSYEGMVPANEVLSRSLNVPSVILLRSYGIEKFNQQLKDMGMLPMAEDDPSENSTPRNTETPLNTLESDPGKYGNMRTNINA